VVSRAANDSGLGLHAIHFVMAYCAAELRTFYSKHEQEDEYPNRDFSNAGEGAAVNTRISGRCGIGLCTSKGDIEHDLSGP